MLLLRAWSLKRINEQEKCIQESQEMRMQPFSWLTINYVGLQLQPTCSGIDLPLAKVDCLICFCVNSAWRLCFLVKTWLASSRLARSFPGMSEGTLAESFVIRDEVKRWKRCFLNPIRSTGTIRSALFSKVQNCVTLSWLHDPHKKNNQPQRLGLHMSLRAVQ